jgi:hypothetical protein
MNHYTNFDPYPIRERNERLREARGSSSASRFVALAVRRGVMPLVRAAQFLS